MKSILRGMALVILLAAVCFWMVTGANRGWTKNQVPVKTIDEVTGIEGVTYDKKFVPGVDFLAAAAVAGFLCAGLSFLFRTKPTAQSSNQQQSIHK